MAAALDPIARMEAYGAEHLTVLTVTALLIAVGVPLVRRVRGTSIERRLLSFTGWITFTIAVLWTLWGLLPMNWNVNESLPFHFSDAMRIVVSIALISRAGWAIAISYYWGLTLNLQSLITPDLNYFHIPVLEFTMYWVLHVVAFVAPIILVWGSGYRPTWRGYALTFAFTCAWSGLAMLINAVTGANYGYLSRAPVGPSILDVLGPWPIYIVWEGVLVLTVWALMTWPWESRHGRRLPYADALRTVRSAGAL